MHFVTHEISAELSPYVNSIFHFKHFMPDHSIERVVPDGFIYLIFELDGKNRNTFDNDSLRPIAEHRTAWLSGLHKHYISISSHKDSEMFVIQFKPAGLQPFLVNPISELNNKITPAEDLFGASVVELREALVLQTDDDQNMFALAEQFLINISKIKQDQPRKLVEKMLNAIQTNSAAQLQDVVSKFNYSNKQAIHIFKNYVGLNPKSYQRIVRFNEILPLIMAKKSIAWDDVCADCFYYDQSHFIKEFKAFCGYSPREFLIQHGNYNTTNFFPLD